MAAAESAFSAVCGDTGDPAHQFILHLEKDVFWNNGLVVTLHVILRHYAYFFIPNYPSDIATVNFDRTGTTKIGKWYFNHSLMVPGLIGVTVACLTGLGLARIFI